MVKNGKWSRILIICSREIYCRGEVCPSVKKCIKQFLGTCNLEHCLKGTKEFCCQTLGIINAIIQFNARTSEWACEWHLYECLPFTTNCLFCWFIHTEKHKKMSLSCKKPEQLAVALLDSRSQNYFVGSKSTMEFAFLYMLLSFSFQSHSASELQIRYTYLSSCCLFVDRRLLISRAVKEVKELEEPCTYCIW